MGVQSATALHYRNRAEAFLRAVKLCRNSEVLDLLEQEPRRYLPAAALLAVHAAISFCDAVLVLKTGQQSTAQNHQEASDRLSTTCRTLRLDESGVRHFAWLVSKKDSIAYGDRRMPETDLLLSVDKVEKFTRWVYSNFADLAPEESNDGY